MLNLERQEQEQEQKQDEFGLGLANGYVQRLKYIASIIIVFDRLFNESLKASNKSS